MSNNAEPLIIQGGMGVAVSDWALARAVAKTGQMGVVSGTALAVVLARRLQVGDPGGHIRRGLAAFPFPEVANRILDRYYIEGGKATDASFSRTTLPVLEMAPEEVEMHVVANFVEVFLAQEDHAGPIGVNYLEKIQLPTLPSIFGAMLAGVDYVLMGAGIPRSIPGILDAMVEGKPVEMDLYVHGASRSDRYAMHFDPRQFCGGDVPWLSRPKFLAIISSATLATMLARKANGVVDGFVVEGPTAGGHNAPPRGKEHRNVRGEPVYGDRDAPDLAAIAALGRPFWLAGSYGTPEGLVQAREMGATGIQVGTAFAFCNESGLEPDIRRQVIEMSQAGTIDVLTDPCASPTGFPFKVLSLPGSLSDAEIYEQRPRICDLGYLRSPYKRDDGSLGWRCGAEDVDAYVRKGGDREDTVGRKCICNSLITNIGLPQVRQCVDWEKPLVTCGNEASQIHHFLPTADADSYSAADVVTYLLSAVETTVASR